MTYSQGARRPIGRASLIASVATAIMVLASTASFAQGRTAAQVTLVPITITNVAVEPTGLVAYGLAGTRPIRAPLTLTPQQTDGACPILNLELGPIELSLLGLNVETSRICLDITADASGGLLGQLLCSLAGDLLNGIPLLTSLGALTSGQLTELTNGLTQILNAALNAITRITRSNVFDIISSASCDILNLAVGPLHLELLGLIVDLDDCEGGPVTVEITASPAGGLLGDLLCSLADLLNVRNPNLTAIFGVLRDISRAIGALL